MRRNDRHQRRTSASGNRAKKPLAAVPVRADESEVVAGEPASAAKSNAKVKTRSKVLGVTRKPGRSRKVTA